MATLTIGGKPYTPMSGGMRLRFRALDRDAAGVYRFSGSVEPSQEFTLASSTSSVALASVGNFGSNPTVAVYRLTVVDGNGTHTWDLDGRSLFGVDGFGGSWANEDHGLAQPWPTVAQVSTLSYA